MKHFFVLFFCFLFFGSCVSLPFDTPENSSWAYRENKKIKGTVRIVSVSAEKPGQWDSLEKEITGLLPLLFWEEGYVTVSSSGRADYSAQADLREREYTDGWRTKRSLSAEIKIRAEGSEGEPLPLSAGRALIQGKQSLSSSKTLSAILRRAVKESVRGLPDKKRETIPRREETR